MQLCAIKRVNKAGHEIISVSMSVWETGNWHLRQKIDVQLLYDQCVCAVYFLHPPPFVSIRHLSELNAKFFSKPSFKSLCHFFFFYSISIFSYRPIFKHRGKPLNMPLHN